MNDLISLLAMAPLCIAAVGVAIMLARAASTEDALAEDGDRDE